MHRHLRLIFAALAACSGKTGTTGLEVTVQYTLLSPGDGCIRLQATPAGGAAVHDDVDLKGRPRSADVTFGVAQAPGWPRPVTLLASLHPGSCDDLAVASAVRYASFPTRGVDALTLEVRETAGDGGMGGGAGGGSAGGGAAGGFAGGFATAGGGTAGGVATAGGGAAGGATAGGGTAGGATAGGFASTFCSDTTALMGCWPMSEGAGTTVGDGSPNRNDGTITDAGPTWVQTDAGTALRFTGTSDQVVSVPDHDSLTTSTALTIEAWIRPTAVGMDGNIDRIVDKGINDEYMFGIGGGGGQLEFSLNGADRYSGGAINITTGSWQHVGVTWASGSAPVFYLNGSGTPAATAVTQTQVNTTQPLAIGNRNAGPSSSFRFQGDMNRVRIYSRAKTAQEMCQAAGGMWNPGLSACM